MNYAQSMNYLSKLGSKLGWRLGLDSIKVLLNKLGNPQRYLKVIHVAGTNGKGSVCAMVSSILIEAGYKVGTYTSPHLYEFEERITINKIKIEKKDMARLASIVKKHHTNQTYFEFLTAMAFLYFKEQKVDFAVLEVGLGGRLDATNVITPLISIITTISIEHTNYLGKTIRKIAWEKAGVIKKNVPIITGARGEALKVIESVAKKNNSRLITIKRSNFKTSLPGKFQKFNAALAAKAAKLLKIPDKIIKKGLLKVSWPGRLQYIEKNVLIDCAHNPQAAEALVKELKNIHRDIILLIAILKDKDIKKILDILTPMAKIVIITKAHVDRAADPVLLSGYIRKPFRIIEDPKKALAYAKSIRRDELIVATGSIYMIGELRCRRKQGLTC